MSVEREPTLISGIAISHSVESYHPDISDVLIKRFSDQRVRLDFATHGNKMPLYLVGPAERTLLITWLNGDNYKDALSEIELAGVAFTASPDRAGANTKELRVLFPFIDARSHKRTRKPIPETADQAVVQAEGVTNIAIARVIKHVAQASSVFTLDIHNLWETGNQFAQEDLELVNLTTNQVFVDDVVANSAYYLQKTLPSIVGSADIGGLLNAVDLSERLGHTINNGTPLPLVINLKSRTEAGLPQIRTFTDTEIEGKRVWVAEDMISSGRTTVETVRQFLERGAAEVIYWAPHAVFVEDYYDNLEGILKDPRVKIVVSNSLPFVRGREKEIIAIPYATKERVNRVRVIEIQDWLADKIEVILKAKSTAEARQLLQKEIIDHTNPYSLLLRLTGQDYLPPIDKGVYAQGVIYSFCD